MIEKMNLNLMTDKTWTGNKEKYTDQKCFNTGVHYKSRTTFSRNPGLRRKVEKYFFKK